MRADITQELKEIREGQFGEDIRWHIYFALCKLAGAQHIIAYYPRVFAITAKADRRTVPVSCTEEPSPCLLVFLLEEEDLAI